MGNGGEIKEGFVNAESNWYGYEDLYTSASETSLNILSIHSPGANQVRAWGEEVPGEFEPPVDL